MRNPVIVSWLLGLFVSVPALGAGQAGFTTNDFRLDVAYTPVMGGTSLMGIAGAYTAIADGLAGTQYNPAAWGSRTAYSQGWWDYDVAFSWADIPLAYTDLDNSGSNPPGLDRLMLVDVGGLLQLSAFGFGLVVQGLTYTFENPANGHPAVLRVIRGGAGVGWSPLGGAFALGASLFSPSIHLEAEGVGQVEYSAQAWELGMLYRPRGRPFRLGLTWRPPVEAALREEESSGIVQGEDEVLRLDGQVLPDRVVFPAELRAGCVYLFGDRQLNRHPDDPIRWPTRRSLLLATDLTLIFASGGLGLEGWIAGRQQATRADSSLAVRLGAEWEVLPTWLRLRTGTYLEPSRFTERNGRLHGTGGVAGRLHLIWDWSLGAAVDWASDYLAWGLSLGMWH